MHPLKKILKQSHLMSLGVSLWPAKRDAGLKSLDVSFLLCTLWKVHSVWAEHCMPVVMMFEYKGSANPLEAVCKIAGRCWGMCGIGRWCPCVGM